MNWGIISHSKFEDIACKYAQDIHGEFNWIPTRKTRDGNKDGEFETKINSLNIIYKGWYEAKHTIRPEQCIDKSHMDSTLVSGILDGSVVYILFITNGHIHRDFRRRAKAILTPYKINVDFVEGDILEEWLVQRSDIYNLFFNEGICKDYVIERRIEVDDVCFFDAFISPVTLINPIRTLIVENEYYLYISIRSNTSTSIDIRICNDCLIPIPKKNNERQVEIHPGFNSFFIKCFTKYLFNGELYLEIYCDFELVTHKTLFGFCIEKNYEPCISYGKQLKIIQEIYNQTIITSSSSSILAVKGKTGTGKSYLLRTLLQNIADKNNDILILKISDKDAENACTLCKLILFLNFGNLYTLSKEAFLELIKNTVNLPLELYNNLREGTQDQIVASSTMKRLSHIIQDQDYSLLVLHPFSIRKAISYIVIDDFQKFSTQYSGICKLLLDEFANKTCNEVMILGYRPNEFKDITIELMINRKYNRSWELDYLTNNDINTSIGDNLNSDIAEVAQLFPKPVNILHLSLLIKKLIEKSITDMPPELQISCFNNCYKETNIQNSLFVKNKILDCKHKDLLFLIYKIESGVTINMIEAFYGLESIEGIKYLINENLVRQEEQLLKPYHDVYLYAFHDINDDLNETLRDFLEFCLNFPMEYPEIESNILALLLINIRALSDEIIRSVKKTCLYYYQTSKYTAAKVLAQALLPDLDVVMLKDFSQDDLQFLYIYAMSIKYSEAHEDSNKYLSLICEIGKLKFLNSNHIGYVYEAYSELLNNFIWVMNKKESLKYINFLENLFTNTVSVKDSKNKVNAYLNLLNRKLLYSAVFSNGINSTSLYQHALTESERLDRKDYTGYAMMDKAKNILMSDLNTALILLNRAYDIFKTDEAYLKRKFDCMAEIVFLEVLLKNIGFDQLYEIQKEAYTRGLLHVYAKATLKILALELFYNYDVNSIELRLKQLFVQYPDMKNKHRLNSFAYMLWSGIYHKRSNYAMCQHYAHKHLNAFKDMSEHYKVIAQHNCKKLKGLDIAWYLQNSNMDESCFWLDLRLW